MNLRERATIFLTKQPRGWLLLEAVVLVAVIGFVDYVTGYEVTFFPFYSIPILMTVWFGNRKFAILISILSALVWWWADTASGHVYSQEWLRIWDTIVRLMFFCLVMYAGSAARQQRDANRARIELLERSHQLEREIIGISEREQQRIGHDLHDGLGQHLVAIGFAADSLKHDLQRDSLRGAAAAGQIGDLIHDAVRRARDLARGLSPVDSHEGGLEAALEELALSASRLTGIPCSFMCDCPVTINDNTQAVHLFRIAQEALNNAAKHSQAKLIVIALEAGNGSLSLRVSDDGVGFDPTRSENNGMGLSIMRYRARMIGAALDIQPNSPNGTVVSCTLAGATDA
jgi:signal transduction histidine kinase